MSPAPAKFEQLAMHQPPKILVVDDEPFNVDYLVQELDELGYQTVSASNGQAALGLVASAQPDLILLDIMTPVMDGFAVLAQLKGDARMRDIPVIIISALNDLTSIVRGIKGGAEDYLPKPFEPVLLHARLGACLEKKRLHELEQSYTAAMEHELQVGHEIQQSFLPARLPQLPGWDLYARLTPARQVAGDFYDAFLLPESGHIVIVIGDVTDKGVGAALYMALYRSLIRVLTLQVAAVAPDDARRLEHIVTLTNRYLMHTHTNANLFASLFIAALDPQSGALTYVNAGHNPPLRVNARQTCEPLAPTGALVGLGTEMSYRAREIRLAQGDVLAAYTDGVIEAQNASGEFYEQERLERLVAEPAFSAQATADRIEKDLRQFVGDAPMHDDVTLLVLRRTA